jgi:hypothetical protein
MEDDEDDSEDYLQELDDKGDIEKMLNDSKRRLISPDEVHTIFR